MGNLPCPTYPRNLNWAALYFYSKLMKFLAFATVYFPFYERFVRKFSSLFQSALPVALIYKDTWLYFRVDNTGYLTYVNMSAYI